jgi:hypothetical protein
MLIHSLFVPEFIDFNPLHLFRRRGISVKQRQSSSYSTPLIYISTMQFSSLATALLVSAAGCAAFVPNSLQSGPSFGIARQHRGSSPMFMSTSVEAETKETFEFTVRMIQCIPREVIPLEIRYHMQSLLLSSH